ncbi:MAG: FtsX-like permease family protein [Fidelibacterota bacterium]
MASRLLFSRKEMGWISLSSAVSILGVALGCFALLLSVAVLNGFENQIRTRVVGFESDVRLTATGLTERDRSDLETILGQSGGIRAHSFFSEKNGVILAGNKRAVVRIKAVQDSSLTQVYHIERLAILPASGSLPRAHLGEQAASRLGVEVGDTLQLVSPVSSQLYLGFPSMVPVVLGSIFRTRILNFDDRYCFVPLSVGRRLFEQGASQDKAIFTQGADIRLAHGLSPQAAISELQVRLPSQMELTEWKDLHKTLFSAMEMEKLGSTLVLSLIILVASFNIASSLVMLVMEKVREIGILRTVGSSAGRIGRVFALQGIMIGGIGLSLGLVFGLGGIFIQKLWGIVKLPEQVYFVPSVPVAISWLDVGVIVAVGSVLIGVSVVYPARLASRLAPTDAVQFEK